jgi:hypothetical protein
VDSLKALDLKRPIREADIVASIEAPKVPPNLATIQFKFGH